MEGRVHVSRARVRVKPYRAYIARLGLLAVGYVVAAKLGLSMATHPAQVTTVWPPSGIALATLLVLGLEYWPGIFIGAFIANLLTKEPAAVALGIAVGNTAEAFVAAYVLKRWTGFKNTFHTPRDAGMYLIVAGLTTIIAAVIGPICLALGGLIGPHDYHVALTWWEGDFMGDLLFGPLLLVYLSPGVFRNLRIRWLEAGILLLTTIGMTLLVFIAGQPGHSLAYLLFPFVIWAATRFIQLGSVTSASMIAIIAIWATIDGMGPFGEMRNQNMNLLNLQLFLCVLSATGLVLALAIAKRQAAEQELRVQTEKLELLESDLIDANKRMTNILEGVLEEDRPRRRGHN